MLRICIRKLYITLKLYEDSWARGTYDYEILNKMFKLSFEHFTGAVCHIKFVCTMQCVTEDLGHSFNGSLTVPARYKSSFSCCVTCVTTRKFRLSLLCRLRRCIRNSTTFVMVTRNGVTHGTWTHSAKVISRVRREWSPIWDYDVCTATPHCAGWVTHDVDCSKLQGRFIPIPLVAVYIAWGWLLLPSYASAASARRCF